MFQSIHFYHILSHFLHLREYVLSFNIISDNCGDNCRNFEENYMAWEQPGIGRPITFMGIQCIVLVSLIFFIESSFSKSLWQRLVASTINGPYTKEDEAVIITPSGKTFARDGNY